MYTSGISGAIMAQFKTSVTVCFASPANFKVAQFFISPCSPAERGMSKEGGQAGSTNY